MADMIKPVDIRDRLRDLNTKAYYLLVALSFIFYKRGDTAACSLKAALSLTALVAVLPVQDYVESDRIQAWIRGLKVACLLLALGFTLWWIWKIS